MRVKTELAERPSEFTIDRNENLAYIRFFTDIKEIQREEEIVYTAEMWEMSVPWMDNLPNRIATNPSVWLAKVKAVTAEEEAAKRLKELERTATDDAICDLAEIVADLMDAVTELASIIA